MYLEPFLLEFSWHNCKRIGTGSYRSCSFQKKSKEGEKFKLDIKSKLISRKESTFNFTNTPFIRCRFGSIKRQVGSTLKGIGPTYMDKTGRNGSV
jgi:adenylosuccinate synthase